MRMCQHWNMGYKEDTFYAPLHAYQQFAITAAVAVDVMGSLGVLWYLYTNKAHRNCEGQFHIDVGRTFPNSELFPPSSALSSSKTDMVSFQVSQRFSLRSTHVLWLSYQTHHLTISIMSSQVNPLLVLEDCSGLFCCETLGMTISMITILARQEPFVSP